MKLKFSNLLPLSIRLLLSKQIRRRLLKVRIKNLIKKRQDEKMFFVLNVPSHGNMGDQLIAYAIEKYLVDGSPNIKVEFFSTGELECGVKYLQQAITPNDIVFITGGGFLGDIYPSEERRFHEVLRCFSNNKIILFPQTFAYKDNSDLLKCAIKCHLACSQLIISTRESASYSFIKSHFSNAQVLLLPDITTYLNFSNSSYDREGILICSRNDKEKRVESTQLLDFAKAWATKNNIPLHLVDTQVPYPVSNAMRYYEINKLIRKFASSRLVITDRLHGMLYSIITGTPVIAIDNTTHKVSGAITNWFKSMSYVKQCSNINEMEQHIFQLYALGGQEFNNIGFVNKLTSILDYV